MGGQLADNQMPVARSGDTKVSHNGNELGVQATVDPVVIKPLTQSDDTNESADLTKSKF